MSAELQEEKQKNAKLEQELKKYRAENEKVLGDLKQCSAKLISRDTEIVRINNEYGKILDDMQSGHE